ncbi:hypothetical protein IJJ08_02975 [bacterium]|nr:hypothetical protein [bacterium]
MIKNISCEPEANILTAGASLTSVAQKASTRSHCLSARLNICPGEQREFLIY